MPGGPPPPPTNPTQLGPFNWNPITFSNTGCQGQMQVTLFSNGAFNFNGTFYDPDFYDLDDSLAFGILSSTGVLYTFTHTGSMHGWGDRWVEGGSQQDSWSNSGSNPAVTQGWNDLCAGYHWQAQAGVNVDVGSLLSNVNVILNAVQGVVKVVALIVAA